MNDTRSCTATGTFSVDSWRDEPANELDEAGAADSPTKVGWVQLTKTFQGDLAGHSTVDMLAVSVGGAPAGYVAIERVVATLAGRSGDFVLQHAATAGPEGQALRIEVVSGTGSAGLAGLRGELEIVRAEDGSHTYSFAYELPETTTPGPG